MIAGQFTSLIFFIAGIGMGYYYAFGKDTDIDGNRYFIFNARSRLIGTALFYGGIALIILEILFSNMRFGVDQ